MSGPYDWLTHDHSEYEVLLFRCQESVSQEDWDTAFAAFESLVAHLKAHMAMEEEILYPAYEAIEEFPQGPTESLRHEHDEIVRHMRDLKRVLKTRNSEHVFESLLPLEKLMIKHHEKEEDIFLPMAGYFLLPHREDILARLEQFDPARARRNWDL